MKLVDRLKNNGHQVVYLREPGGTAISEAIREILLDNRYSEMHARTELFLYAAARAQIVEEIIRPALHANEIVICDRFADSTTAYQGFGRGLDLEMILSLNRFATGNLVPQITILLDIPPELANERRRAARLKKDRLENEKRAFYERVREGYLELAKREPQRFLVMDGRLNEDEIHRMIWQKLAPILSDKAKAMEDK